MERVDNAKGYSPANVIWADKHTQLVNRRVPKHSKTGLLGIRLRAGGNYQVRLGGKVHGTFKTLEEAIGKQHEVLNRVKHT
ncbi:HNH endonuclease [Vibrio phage 1.097.O._10N.286.49.B3]|uniref:Uncharacterized protein n=1 Tax=Vibrio phage 1.097.O._10N.286.49.B3 TaxID=1881383 RepID=A0A2I7R0M0_9CAUD|nr:HNH endonuclease [Vibrio phage 1.097.O._10N.286.49.B3]AUR87191.1 hypothetical protein NVP1097O_45 [Vibrio phage 1.097.O._10N.286.49.B3]